VGRRTQKTRNEEREKEEREDVKPKFRAFSRSPPPPPFFVFKTNFSQGKKSKN
jgi:hypothetical protein